MSVPTGQTIVKSSPTQLYAIDGKMVDSPILAVHGHGHICIIKFHFDLVGNQPMKPLHRLSLDEHSVFTL